MRSTKRRFSPHEKEEIVKGIQNSPTVREGLAKHKISIPTYYKWKHELSALPHEEPLPPPEEPRPEAAAPPEEPPKPHTDIARSTKRRFSPHEKEEIVKGIQNSPTVREGLVKHKISIPTYYKWKHELSALPHEEPLPPPEEPHPEAAAPPEPPKPDKEIARSTKRRFSPHEKEEIVKGIQNSPTVKIGLAKHKISIPTYYKWKHELSALPHEGPLPPPEEPRPEPPAAPPEPPKPLAQAAPVEAARRADEIVPVSGKTIEMLEPSAPAEPYKPPVKKRWYIYTSLIVLGVFVITFIVYLALEKPAEEKTILEFPDSKSQREASTGNDPEGMQTGPDTEDRKQVRGLIPKSNEWTGDFDKMLEHRRIRVLVPTSRTLFFTDKGQERGLIGDAMRDFERYLNKKYAKRLGKRPLTVFIVPETRDALLTGVAKGLGDIAAGDITVTEERLKTVDFVAPDEIPRASEILLTGPKSPAVAKIDDLAGKTIHVRKSTSYFESLMSVNNRLKKERHPQIKIALVPDALEDEDLMEMLNAGLFEFLVVDNRIAKLWAQVLPNIKLREDIVFRSGGKIGWAIRKGSPKLEVEIMDFYRNFIKKYNIMESRLAQYHKRIKQIQDPTGTAEWKRFEQTIGLFKKYGEKYKFDPLMLAAQGYQESTLDQNKRSPAGAIGIMQIMPRTGASLKVGNIKLTEPNIHGGAKYMDNLMSVYFRDTKFSDHERTLFAFASYNAGPDRILKMRKLAEKRGLDPNKWFNSVELVTAEKIGYQTTTYVRNIYKYYIAYTLTRKAQEDKRKAREHALFNKDRRSR
ncbi:MAG: transposase [Syntrophales bacterium]